MVTGTRSVVSIETCAAAQHVTAPATPVDQCAACQARQARGENIVSTQPADHHHNSIPRDVSDSSLVVCSGLLQPLQYRRRSGRPALR